MIKIHYDIFKELIKYLKFNLFNMKLNRSFTNKMNHVKDNISGLKDKLEELEHPLKENEKFNRTHDKKIQDIWDSIKKPQLYA